MTSQQTDLKGLSGVRKLKVVNYIMYLKTKVFLHFTFTSMSEDKKAEDALSLIK